MMLWSSSPRRYLDTRMEPERSVMSKHSTAPPRFWSWREVDSKTSPSTTTLPDSSVRSRMGVVLPFMVLPMSTSPADTEAPTALLWIFTTGLGWGKSGVIFTLCKPYMAPSLAQRDASSAGAGILSKWAESAMVISSRLMSQLVT